MSLLYFGLTFYRLNVPGPIKDPIKLQDVKEWPDWDTFKELIATDLKKLNKGSIGCKNEAERREFDEWVEDGEFTPVQMNIFVYHHTFHAVCSSVGLKQLRDSGVPIIVEPQPMCKCTEHEKKDHDRLQPFFCDDYGLEMLYMERITNEQADAEYYRSCLHDLRARPSKFSGFFMDENDWTMRFVTSLQDFFSTKDYRVFNTTKEEGINFESFQRQFSKLQNLSSAYIFHGSPDVMIQIDSSNTSLVLSNLEVLDNMIEMVGPGKKIVAKDYTGIPEKMGELVASLYWLLVANVVKEICVGSSLSTVTTRGLLLDKYLNSAIHCQVEGRLCDVNSNDRCGFSIRVSQPFCGRMSPAWLCFHLQKLLE